MFAAGALNQPAVRLDPFQSTSVASGVPVITCSGAGADRQCSPRQNLAYFRQVVTLGVSVAF